MKSLKWALIIALLCIVPGLGLLFADDEALDMNMVVGDVQTIGVRSLTRISVTNPEIVDISDVQKNEVVLLAKQAGQTLLFLWDADGKRIVTLHVAGEDLKAIKDRLSRLLAEVNIKNLNFDANATEGKLIISGQLPKEKKVNLEKIIDPFRDQVINLVQDELNDDLVQIDMQITEIASSLTKNLGIVWGSAGASSISLVYGETRPPDLDGSKDWLKLGQFNRQTSLQATLNLLISEGKARSLSRPRILVKSGKEATINVGGEIPIQTTTANSAGGSVQTNVTFKQYGITLTVSPTVIEGKIDINMNLQVTDIDPATPVGGTSGNNVAYKTRTAQTQLLLDDQQTVVFAGLIRYADSVAKKRVPFLGKIPIVGLLFRSTSNDSPDETRELVVTMTPSILRKKTYTNEQTKLPTSKLKALEEEVDRLGYGKEHMPSEQEMPKKTSAAATGASSAGTEIQDLSEQDINPYVRSIQTRISRGVYYPPQALNNNWQGTVKLKLRILKDGSLANAAILESSGHPIFDQNALTTAQRVAPYDPFPNDIKGSYLNITIPIVYSQASANVIRTQTVTPAY